MANLGFGEFDIPFIQNPFTNKNQGSVPILQKNWAGWSVNPQEQAALGLGQAQTGAYVKDAQTTTPGYANAPGTSQSIGGGSAGPAYDPSVLAQYDQAIGTSNSALGRLAGQLGIAQGNINTTYGQKNNELESSKAAAKSSYDTSSTQNSQQYRTNKNTIADQASNGLRGLQRLLGAYGAGGSSDAKYVAPQAVTQQASQQQAGAGQTYAGNQQGLDTNWGNFQMGFDNNKKQLEDWKNQQLNQVQAQSESTKQDLLSKLADLTGKRAAYQGGSYTGAAQPFLDQANALSGQIDQLAKINPTYTGTTPTYEAAPLSSYVNNGSAAVGGQNALEQSSTPFLSLLLGQQKDKRQLGL
jgi:hypothetical protein